VLERASIDELFMDVTDYCHEQCEKEQNDAMDTNGISEAMQHTVSVGETPNDNNRQDDNHDPEEDHDDKEDNDNLQQALYHGCQIAYTIRQAVYSQLGFTMSAGISVNKLLAKLGASYGKPNGQALIKPSAIPYIMKNTLISKARHFGGKIGKQVENLLPPDAERTMSSIAESLSLPTLTAKLGADTARTVFDACRGVDHEPVKHTVNALVKSITAFKSFQSTCISSGEMHEWLVLLATEIVSRVTHDSHRNSRYPKTCTVQYATDATNRRSQTNKSLRIAFPPETKVESDAVSKLVDKAKEVIAAKEGRNVCLIRVGYCASDFQTRLKNGGISSYFNAAGGESVAVKGDENKSPSRALVEQEDSKPVASFSQQAAKKPPSVLTVDNDLELARKLQASYDRENALLTAAEKRDGSTSAQPKRNKKARIDSFFVKKKS
jgi:DNA polymerase eta